MDTKYIFIDDENDNLVKGIKSAFESSIDGIKVSHVKPLAWSEQIMSIKNLFNPSNLTNDLPNAVKQQVEKIRKDLEITDMDIPNGIIFDLRLDLKVNTNYKGNSFAQEIRNLSTDKLLIDFPLVLCSGGSNLKALYTPDTTSHDLFDLKIEKESINRKNKNTFRQQLIALSNGYKEIDAIINSKQPENLSALLGDIPSEKIDYRLLDNLSLLKERKAPVHEFARFILINVIIITGVLIDNNFLMARLGIDEKKITEEDQVKIQDAIKCTEYNGVFSLGWKRWWMDEILEWWRQSFTENNSLGNLTAEERVRLLNQKFNTNLIPATKTKLSRSEYFWYVCKATKKPIAYEDGVLSVSEYDRVPWQEDQYYSSTLR